MKAYSVRGIQYDVGNVLDWPWPIEDVGLILSNQCRYGGHVERHYSVAEHSVLVSRLVAPEYALEGLMHDAHEVPLQDLTAPLLRSGIINYGQYIITQSFWDQALCRSFPVALEKLHSTQVYHADMLAREIEKAELIHGTSIGALPGCISPSHAKNLFLCRYDEIVRKMKT